jgi:hypothetical protein
MCEDGGSNSDAFDTILTDSRVSVSDFSLEMCWLEKIRIFVLESSMCGAQTVLMVLSAKIALASKSLHKAKKSKGFLKMTFEGAFCDEFGGGDGGDDSRNALGKASKARQLASLSLLGLFLLSSLFSPPFSLPLFLFSFLYFQSFSLASTVSGREQDIV